MTLKNNSKFEVYASPRTLLIQKLVVKSDKLGPITSRNRFNENLVARTSLKPFDRKKVESKNQASMNLLLKKYMRSDAK
jgi:hypothetical protein